MNEDNKLPEDFVKEGLELASGSLLFGVSFSDMSRDDLVAAAASGWEAYRKCIEEGSSMRQF